MSAGKSEVVAYRWGGCLLFTNETSDKQRNEGVALVPESLLLDARAEASLTIELLREGLAAAQRRAERAEALAGENEGDARRYRFLRDNWHDLCTATGTDGANVVVTEIFIGVGEHEPILGSSLDSAIDAAIDAVGGRE